jgi:hypothetical protein
VFGSILFLSAKAENAANHLGYHELFVRANDAERNRERETSEIRRRSGGSGPPLRTALQNSKLPGMFPEFVAGRLDEPV